MWKKHVVTHFDYRMRGKIVTVHLLSVGYIYFTCVILVLIWLHAKMCGSI